MPEIEAIKFYDAARILDARDKLFVLNSFDYPNMEKNSRQKLHSEIRKEAYPDYREETLTTDQLANQFASMVMNGR